VWLACSTPAAAFYAIRGETQEFSRAGREPGRPNRFPTQLSGKNNKEQL